ncbi:low temperature requirement protein A [Streptacidiphilus jiangxiensis]|uniref:Low temperature requirement protein LtrA n=1 Tax=Streptacidiphilus jiangxiensis TaxID=235985 RepID=A0A1H7JA78_STRJI|nr:low temperature requirement protein A [Streptacidiphilus jiangxiensis]SEK71252.1 Low temperature requirement protein LtrA [Streptacidiphilus jiangxiensis]
MGEAVGATEAAQAQQTQQAQQAHGTTQAAGARRVSTLELFFDLVFVFTITQLTVLLADDLSLAQAGRVLLIFAVLYWMYGAYAYLTNQVPPETTARRLLLVVGMFGFLVCALALPQVFGADGVVFGLGFLLVTAVHSALYALIHRQYVLSFAVTNLGAAGCVTAAGAVHGWAADGLWVAAVLLHQITPVLSSRITGRYGGTTARVTEAVGGLDPAHFVERHGLLLLIAFGESVVAIGAGATGERLAAPLLLAVGLALTLVAALWWTYFDADEAAAETALHRAAGLARFRLAMAAYYYSFIPMLLAVAILAAGVKKAIGHLAQPLPFAPAAALAGGVALFLLGNLAFRAALGFGPLRVRAVAVPAALATIPLGRWTPVAQFLGLTLVLAAMLLVESRQAVEGPEGSDRP